MAFALVNYASADGSPSGATTGAIDTTGADLIVLAVAGPLGSMTISDSKSNTWSTAVASSTVDGFGASKISYCLAPTVGSGHTFSCGGTAYSGIIAAAFSGADAGGVDQTNSQVSGSSSTTGNPGSIFPTYANELVVFAGPTGNDGSYLSATSEGTVLAATVGTSGNDYGSGLGYLIQTAAAVSNPTLTWNQSTPWAAVIASFIAAVGAGSQIQRRVFPRSILNF